jgi:hypothetical protein
MQRTQVYLRRDQHLRLKRAARSKNRSMTNLLREAVDEYLARPGSVSAPDLRSITALGRGRSKDASLRHDEVFAKSARKF